MSALLWGVPASPGSPTNPRQDPRPPTSCVSCRRPFVSAINSIPYQQPHLTKDHHGGIERRTQHPRGRGASSRGASRGKERWHRYHFLSPMSQNDMEKKLTFHFVSSTGSILSALGAYGDAAGDKIQGTLGKVGGPVVRTIPPPEPYLYFRPIPLGH